MWLFLQFKNRNVGAKLSKESDMKQSIKKITFKTFKKCPFKVDFSAEID